jgi:predicted lipid-binding transport protein (Tim44 family)
VGGHVVEDPDAVRRLMELWELLRRQTLDPDESLRWLSGLS